MLELLEKELKEIEQDVKMSYSMNETIWEEYRNFLLKAELRVKSQIDLIKTKLDNIITYERKTWEI
jgi:hypothetical protein